MGQLRLAPGAKLPAGCDKLQIVVEIHALSAALEDPALGRRASRVFSPSELSETAVDFSWPIHGHDDSPALVEALAAMQRGEADYK